MQRAKQLYRRFMQDGLYRNSIYLLANLGIASIAGFLFVLACTHLYSKQAVGYATALIGALNLVTALSNIGMNRTVVRFLGQSKTKSRDIVTKLLLVAGASLLVGIVLAVSLKSFGVRQITPVDAVIFVITAFFASVKLLFDNIFIATRTAIGTLIENSAFSLFKLGVPFLLVGAGFMGIFGAQLIGYVIAVVLSVVILTTKLKINLRVRPSKASMRGKWQFALGSYSADLIGGLPASVLPIIVVGRLGAAEGALWYAAMQIINFLLMISSSINQAMFAEVANAEPHELGRIIRKAAVGMYALILPLSAAVFLFARSILGIFGPSYANAAHVLSLMSIFALVGVINYITGSVIALYKKVFYLTAVNIANALTVLVYCLTFAHDLTGIAAGWMLGEVVNVLLFVGGCLYFSNQQGVPSVRAAEGAHP